MRTNTMRFKKRQSKWFCLLLTIGLMSIVTSVGADEPKVALPLKVIGGYGNIQLDYPFWVQVDNLEKWAAQPGYDVKKFVLCLDGHAFYGLPSPSIRPDNTLGFYIRLSPECRDAWKAMVGRPFSRNGDEVAVTVLYDSAKIEGVHTARINIGLFAIVLFLVIAVISIILFCVLAHRSDMIRGPGPQPIGISDLETPNRKPYSLGRTQMAWWFFVVVISYVFIWMLSDDIASLTPQVLTLIGISVATGLGSAIVDSSKSTGQVNLRRALEAQNTKDEADAEKLRTEIDAFNAVLNTVPAPGDLETQRSAIIAKQGDLAAKEKKVEETTRKIRALQKEEEPSVSKGFLTDILSDENGISFHRFQMFAWTIVLTVIFIMKVYKDLCMPDFDPSLLALMGISGGTYIGFKLPAQQG